MGIGSVVHSLMKSGPAKVAIFALAGLYGLGYHVGHKFESNRDKLIPVSFSEISQIKDAAASRGEEIPAHTLYYAGLWDSINKIHEDWNRAWKYSQSENGAYKKFAELLKKNIEEHAYRHNLADFLKSVPEDAGKALQELNEFRQAKNRIGEVNGHFSRTWKDKHDDDYRTETYLDTEYSTDSNGNSQTRTVLKTREVYDHTHHKYTYFKNEGEAASEKLDKLLVDFANLTKTIKMETGKVVQKENLDAIKESRGIDKPEKEKKEGEYFVIANTWKFGSSLDMNSGTFANPFQNIRPDADKWRQAKLTAHNENYQNTKRESEEPGPLEFRVVKTTMKHNEEFTRQVNEVAMGMEIVKKDFPKLEKIILNYVQYTLYPEEYKKSPGFKKPKSAAKEIRKLVTSIHDSNFKGGFETERYRTWMVALMGVLGLLGGAALGYGIHRVTDGDGRRERSWPSY